MPVTWEGAPLWDVEGVHDILREWRAIADSYDGDRMYVGEVVVNGAERLARYMRPDELHTTFNLDFLKSPLDPAAAAPDHRGHAGRRSRPVGAPATWTLSNHDETRHLTRYGRAYTGVPLPPPWPFPPSDRALGTRRARAVLLLLLALPGSVYLYQGEELGLWEVEDLADEHIADPVWESSRHTIRGRDGCRVPIPWSGDRAAVRVQRRAHPWLPQPAEWRDLHRRGRGGPGRTRCCTTTGRPWPPGARLRPRCVAGADLAGGPDGVLAFHRGSFGCMINFSDQPVPVNGPVLLSSAPVVDGAAADPMPRSGPQACRVATRPPSTPLTKAGDSSVDSSETRCTASETTTAGGRSR